MIQKKKEETGETQSYRSRYIKTEGKAEDSEENGQEKELEKCLVCTNTGEPLIYGGALLEDTYRTMTSFFQFWGGPTAKIQSGRSLAYH